MRNNSSSVESSQDSDLIRDIFVTCSTDRDRTYTLTINLELDSPFKNIKIRSENPLPGGQAAEFNINLPQSTFLVQLKQCIRYDECLDVIYVQLAPGISYETSCNDCSEAQRRHIDKILSKRMSQLEAELDSMLSDKLSFGLQVLLSQQRFDLDLYLGS